MDVLYILRHIWLFSYPAARWQLITVILVESIWKKEKNSSLITKIAFESSFDWLAY